MISLNGEKIRPTVFPDKTSQVWKIKGLKKRNHAYIEWYFEDEREFIQLAQLKVLLDKYRCTTALFLPYLPYARQDKPVSNGKTFALHAFAKLLNSLGFQFVTCIDPHSKIPEKIIRNFLAVYPMSMIYNLVNQLEIDAICYPDHGAKIKYGRMLKPPNCKMIYGEKIRDQKTGTIKKYRLIGKKIARKRVLIVDDICDGGATFISLSKLLKKRRASNIYLYVSHGLFSKGTKILKKAGIEQIFTKEGEITT